MKRLFLILIIIMSQNFVFGQQVDRHEVKSYKYFYQLGNGVFYSANEYGAPKIFGSQYLNKFFSDVMVAEVTAKMRYNVYKDEFEFITPKNDTLILDKKEKYASLEFIATKTKYLLTNYADSEGKINFGYLINIHEKGNFGLFKKDNILIQEEKIAKTTLEANMPAKYYNASSTYFLKNDKNFIKFPESKKQLVKIFPDKKEMIEKFLKENKIDFDITEEKIKIIDFLTTL